MAKKEKSRQKANLYLFAIVAIVAVVGIVVLVLNSGGGSLSLGESDLSGQASGICPKAYSNGCSGIWTFVKSEGICTCIVATQVKIGSGETGSVEGNPVICCCDPPTDPCKCGLTSDCSQCKGKC